MFINPGPATSSFSIMSSDSNFSMISLAISLGFLPMIFEVVMAKFV